MRPIGLIGDYSREAELARRRDRTRLSGPMATLAGSAASLIREGRLEVRLPGGQILMLGDDTGPLVRVAIADVATCARIAADPQLAVGEAWMDRRLILERGSLYDFIDLTARNAQYRVQPSPPLWRRWLSDRWRQANGRVRARHNVAHHYDLSADFYRLFLDADLQYSCAYYPTPGLRLEQAQDAKKRHIAAKLLLEPGMRVLDIGCGFGGLALDLARGGAMVDGITLSTEQLNIAYQRAGSDPAGGRTRFSLSDYRDVKDRYDRIVSVGMFEHVGRPNYAAYFQQVARLLKDDGVALIHTIGRTSGPGFTQPWIAKHIFPGGYIPALSEVTGAAERAGLIVTDVEVLRLHYAETLSAWRRRFDANRARVARMFDERFCRMWEFYLCASEASFRHGMHCVFQLQLAHRVDAAPITRDYLCGA